MASQLWVRRHIGVGLQPACLPPSLRTPNGPAWKHPPWPGPISEAQGTCTVLLSISTKHNIQIVFTNPPLAKQFDITVTAVPRCAVLLCAAVPAVPVLLYAAGVTIIVQSALLLLLYEDSLFHTLGLPENTPLDAVIQVRVGGGGGRGGEDGSRTGALLHCCTRIGAEGIRCMIRPLPSLTPPNFPS